MIVILHKLSVNEVTVVGVNLHELHDTPILPKNVYYVYQASCESNV